MSVPIVDRPEHVRDEDMPMTSPGGWPAGMPFDGTVTRFIPPWRTESIKNIAAALAKAQKEIKNAAKDRDNPFFRSKYADLASVWDACREPLASNELAVTQHPTMEFQGKPEIVKIPTRNDGERVVVRCIMTVSLSTRLLHSSGEYLESTLQSILPSADPQTVGSALTYLRRYGLASMVGVAPEDEDDDGNAGSGNGNHPQAEQNRREFESRQQPRPAQRQSQQPPRADGASTPTTPAKPATAAAGGTLVGGIGKIVKVKALPSGDAWSVELEGGFKCGTKSKEIADKAEEFRVAGTVIEIAAKPARLAGYSPVAEWIDVVKPEPTEEREPGVEG